jgi:hypothetical protein
MVTIPLPVDGLSAWRDVATGEFELACAGARVRLREWTWGERRRLVEACARDGRLDRSAFLDGLLELLCDPPPPVEMRTVFGFAALALLGVGGGPVSTVPLPTTEAALARELGWTPSLLDGQAASAVDRVVAALGGAAPVRAPVDDGWTRIVVDDG